MIDAAPVPYLAIFLDEIENIIPYQTGDEESMKRYVYLMQTLRSLQHETNCISMIVAGVHPTLARKNYFWGDQKNPMHQVIMPRFLKPLEKNECDMMIRSLGQEIGIDFHNETSSCIFKKSGGHPYLARQLCNTAYCMNKKPGIISMDVILAAAEEYVYNPAKSDYFDDNSLWGELGKSYIWGSEVSKSNHSILLDIASNSGGLSKNELLSNIETRSGKRLRNFQQDRISFEKAIYGLIERSIVEIDPETKRYYITIELLQDWIRIHKLGKSN